MSLLYADTSAVISAFLADEPDRDKLTELLLSGEHKVVTSELIRTDFARVITAARFDRSGRLSRAVGLRLRLRCHRPVAIGAAAELFR